MADPARASPGTASPSLGPGNNVPGPMAANTPGEENRMSGSVDQNDSVKPSEQRGGTTPGAQEAREKGEWAARADEGVVPAALGGSDAPKELLDDDPELASEVLGQTARSEEPAT